MNDPLRRALRRNALLSEVMEEGYLPSQDAELRDRVRRAMHGAVWRRRARRFLLVAAALVAALLTVPSDPAPAPPPVPSARAASKPLEAYVVVTTAAAGPVFEIVATPATSAIEVVHTAQLIGPLDRARDEELLATAGVVGIVGHPGGIRRVILATPTPHRNLE